ncbi:MAG: cysteine dioxygenase family protein, partial [Kofleriaceae bacterium]
MQSPASPSSAPVAPAVGASPAAAVPPGLAALLAEVAAAAAHPDGPSASLVARLAAAADELCALTTAPSGDPYSRRVIGTPVAEVMLARWQPGARCAAHDHGGSRGFVVPLRGAFVETRYGWHGDALIATGSIDHAEGRPFAVGAELIHAMADDGTTAGGGVTLHAYAPPPARMGVYDLDAGELIDVVGDVGAWIPTGGAHPRVPLATVRRPEVVWIGYTTQYRGGSAEFAVAAATLARELAQRHGDAEVRLCPLERKADFVAAMERLGAEGRTLRELHFVGHSGMYGVMFGSVAWPEQLSPHEWRALAARGALPFSPGGQAYFHACRTGRWFAPFFARTFGVTAHGHHGYTTVSARPDR